ncbi:hypothetical protein QTI24_21790 [Variovorax sp. J22P240]|uniref:hypothetical protein n=1 Tax=Variovorax sp. J22P240 TaxID=3053514 RepID=UPI0025760682|nr:hypothetical protein [Variovorax sp. J22P240]MDM0001254.1 hypothetical protein [Variovorax sp. J22P240]
MTPVEQLQARFAYMFQGESISLEFHEGWLPIFREACEQIDDVLGENKRGFHWVQVKEKYGSARFYYHLGTSRRLVVDFVDGQGGHALIKTRTKEGDSAADRIDAIVDHAEARTYTTCMVCGAAAQTEPYDGYYLTVCAAHAPARRFRCPEEL